jgi:hypothetical protein
MVAPIAAANTVMTTRTVAATLRLEETTAVPVQVWPAGSCMCILVVHTPTRRTSHFLDSAVIVIGIILVIALAVGLGVWRRRVYLATRQTTVYTQSGGVPVHTVTQYAY